MSNSVNRPLSVKNPLSNQELIAASSGVSTVEELEKKLGRLVSLNEASRARYWAGLS